MSLRNTDVRTPGAAAIAQKWNLPLAKVYSLISQGAKVEFEHNRDKEKAKQVARDHINERPDYYKRLKHMERLPVRIKEESGIAGVRGFGNVTGDPAVGGANPYVNTNSMSYEDINGNKLGWIKKKHKDLHNKKLGFSSFDPTNMDGNKNFVNEQSLNELGDYGNKGGIAGADLGDVGGGKTLLRKQQVKEVSIHPKVKKAVATGMTLANIATLGQVAGNAAEGRGSPKRDVVAAASGLPGKVGWGATAGHYSLKGMDKVKQYIKDKKQMKEDKDPCWKGYQQVGMKKKGGRKVPNCVPVKESGQVMSRYTERPTYEGYASIGHAYDWAGDVNSKAKFYGNKPKATTTKNDEKDDTYKDSNKGKKVKFAKTVKEAQISEISHGLALKAMKKSEKRANDEYETDQAHDRLSDYQTHDDRAARLRGHMLKKFGNDKPGRGNTGGDKLSGRTMSDRLTHGKRAGMPSARHKNDLKSSIKYSLGQHPKANLPEEEQINEFEVGKAVRGVADMVAPGISGAYDAAKQGNYADAANKAATAGVGFMASRVAPAAAGVLKSTSAAAAEMTPDMENKIRSAKASGQNVGPVNEIKASTVGRAVAKASAKRKELTSKKMGDKEVKKWWKMERLVRRGTEKLTGKSKVPPSMEDDPPFFPSHGRKHTKGSSAAHKLAVKAMKKQMKEGMNPNKPDTALVQRPGAMGITKTIHEDTRMDSKELVNEAIVDIMDENLIDMKEHFLAALNEKVQEKLEERKKDIASNYFGQ